MSATKMIAISSKRKDENQAKPSTKKLKRRDSVNSEDSGPLKIIGVNDDCLERVFDYLNATDLNNVADAHPCLVPAARMVFKQKYSDQWICIRESGRILWIWNNTKRSREIVNATPRSFVTNFGKLILKLDLDYKNDSEYEDAHHWREIEGVIFEHCTETLTEIALKKCRGSVLEEIRKPFENVEKLYIDNGFIEPTKVDSNNCFPNIRHFNVLGTAVRNADCMKGNFRCLEYVGFRIMKDDDVAEGNIRNFIQSNPHIVRMFINSNFGDQARVTAEFLAFLSETLAQLHTLYLRCVEINEVDVMKHIHFPNVERLCLDSVEYPKNVSITFGQLKSLDLWNVPSNPKWMKFIEQNKSIISLLYGIEPVHNIDIDDLIKIVNGLPDLNHFRFGLFPFNEVIPFLKVCEPLQNLKTIGKVIYEEENVEDEIQKIEKRMGGKLKSIFGCPTIQQAEIEYLSFSHFQSIDFSRKFK